MPTLIKFKYDKSMAFSINYFEKIFEKAKTKAAINQIKKFTFKGWPYIVVDMDFSESEDMGEFLSKRDKIGEIEVLFKRSISSKLFPKFFPNKSSLRKFVIYDDMVCGVEIELKSC